MLPDSLFNVQTFRFGSYSFAARMPDPDMLAQWYKRQSDPPSPSSLYWAKVWPSALAMCTYLADHPAEWKDKKVLEIAAGIGLPSLMLAPHVQTITCTDISEEAVNTIKISAHINGYENIHIQNLNWMNVPENLQANLLLLSDVNYAPADLENLNALIQRFLIEGCLVILSTPERIAARSFIQDFLSFVVKHESFPVEQETIHVYVLSKTPSGSVTR